MESVLYIIAAFLLLSILIILHELGHYLVGKLLGFTVVEFSIGLGPKLFGKKGKETEFTLRALPVGGSCRFYGEDQEVQDERCFNAQKPWKRFLVVAAGPAVNIVFALLLSFCLLLAFGTVSGGGDAVVQLVEIETDAAADRNGLQSGDIVLRANGAPVLDVNAFVETVREQREDRITLLINRGGRIDVTETVTEGETTVERIGVIGGEELTVVVEGIRDKTTGNNRLGVTLNGYYSEITHTEYNVFSAAIGAFPYCWEITKSIYQSLWQLVSCQVEFSQMSGVVGTVDVMSRVMQEGETAGEVVQLVLMLLALISVNLGIVNLLPLPALDGGRLIFLLLEMLRGKPIPPEKEGFIHFAGLVLLLLLMVVLTVSDVLRCFGG